MRRVVTLQRDLENDPHIQQNSGHIDIKEFHNQGGFSGTLILNVPHQQELTTVVPIGIFYQGIDTLSQISYIRHLDYINPDGTLRM
jgi:ammonia channel protein AmtB